MGLTVKTLSQSVRFTEFTGTELPVLKDTTSKGIAEPVSKMSWRAGLSTRETAAFTNSAPAVLAILLILKRISWGR